MGFTFEILAPVAAIILCGFLLKRLRFISDEGWAGIEKLIYYFFLPSLLIHVFSTQEIKGKPWDIILTVTTVVVFLFSLTLIIGYRVIKVPSGAAFTSIFQGAVRFNTFVTLAICDALYGETGLLYAALVSGFMIVSVNFFSVAVLTWWGEKKQIGQKALVKELCYNPLIIGTVLGWAVSFSGLKLSFVIGDVLSLFAKAALPMGLMAVGAALNVKKIRHHFPAFFITSLFQYIGKPFLTLGLISFLDIRSEILRGVLLISMISPTAPSSYILAKKMGGDADLMASLISFQTLLAFFVIPIYYRFFF